MPEHNLRNFPWGKVLISLSAAGTGIGVFIADWNESHIYNPAWPPHAKFHNAQTMSMGVALALVVLYYLWKPAQSRATLATGAVVASIYGLTQLSVAFYPGVSSVDPPGENTWPQLLTTLPSLGFVLGGYLLERRRLHTLPYAHSTSRKEQ
ncbi:DUF6640 family protein [Paractinoplanes brasiliensis]|uniref:Acetyltransferase n=1 Tax=Paractinoplanes brasiliensis TaxID=52695 RepID=A0A4V3C8G9_9ACTN|nr:DUF6640 family protein [Actinoplanes brasiliensis]TDO41218.1 hypothetical protein C8E87_4947 [Actinoplanes brasiliensis]GID26288.1 hypothetical protein Abr02nite_12710 [Actinoplanes brasiliensis]